MNLSKKDFFHIIKSAFLGGAFSLMAYATISAAYFFSQDDFLLLGRSLRANTLNFWFEHHFKSIEIAFQTLGQISVTLLLSFIGYLMTIFSLSMLDYTKKYLTDSLNRKSNYVPIRKVSG